MSLRARQNGMTLVEVLIATAIFIMLALALYGGATVLFSTVRSIRTKTVLTELASQRMEFIRNLMYSDVGTVGGIPSGVIVPNETIVQNGQSFLLSTTIRNVDNVDDGVLGGIPNDLSPADNKLVHITASCISCDRPQEISYTSIVAPKQLETENGNGVLMLKVVDANGQPVTGAEVRVTNTSLTPIVDMTDVTDSHGLLAIVDAPPSLQQYRISATKDGYSTEQTYPYGAVGNPTPTKPDLTVSAHTITQDTFAIDRLSELSFAARTPACTPVSALPIDVTGAKLIGTPSVAKYAQTLTTDSGGNAVESAAEWDTYTVALGSSAYRLVGTSTPNPITIAPGTAHALRMLLVPTTFASFDVAVLDQAGTPIPNATITLTKSGTVSTYETGMSYHGGVNWSTAVTSSTNLDATTPGTVTLQASNGIYPAEGELVSQTIDMGTSGEMRSITWSAQTPSGTSIGLQFAANNDNQTWNFVGPDGTSGTYFSSTPSMPYATGMRYLRYRIILATSDTTQTPQLSDLTIGTYAPCLLEHVFHVEGLPSGTYSMQVQKTGFATTSKTITIPSTSYEAVTLTSL